MYRSEINQGYPNSLRNREVAKEDTEHSLSKNNYYIIIFINN